LWELNMITVAAEHLATSLSESIMNELYEQIISDVRISKKVVLGCVENELHQVGIKMVADIFEMHGWDTFFLGAGIPTSEFISYIHDIKPDIVALSLTVYSHLPSLINMIEEIRISFPEIPVFIGGQAFRHGGSGVVLAIPNVFVFNNLIEIESFITKI
jgi:MerR family transcriptional regulator, light-induced transcriptional regulator